MILGPQTRRYPLLITVGLLVVTFLAVSEEQRTGVVENLQIGKGLTHLMQITQLLISIAVKLGVVSGDDLVPARVRKGTFSSCQHWPEVDSLRHGIYQRRGNLDINHRGRSRWSDWLKVTELLRGQVGLSQAVFTSTFSTYVSHGSVKSSFPSASGHRGIPPMGKQMITQVIPVTTQAPLTVTRVFSILGRNLFLIEAELGLRRPLFYKLNLNCTN